MQISKITSLVDDFKEQLDPVILNIDDATARLTTAENKMNDYLSDLDTYLDAVAQARVCGVHTVMRAGACYSACQCCVPIASSMICLEV